MSDKMIKRILGLLAVMAMVTLPAMAQAPYEGRGGLTGGSTPSPGAPGDDCGNPDNPVANCSFEDMFTSWVPMDAAAPFVPLQTIGAGASTGFGFFLTEPTDGLMVAVHGFDAAGPDTIQLAQDISVPAGGTGTLTFDYRGAWDLQTFGATMDRTFEVNIEPMGGGAPLQTDLILTASAGTNVLDTGAMTGMVDVSPFTGQDVRINFVWNIPENFSGPGQFQVDNVNVLVEPGGLPIPTMGFYGAALLTVLLMLFGLRVLSRTS